MKLNALRRHGALGSMRQIVPYLRANLCHEVNRSPDSIGMLLHCKIGMVTEQFGCKACPRHQSIDVVRDTAKL
ncbi:hypothetical protein R5H30_07705 [Sulfitobacter sp. D35]|uniref:hypothetical protein n=1 Tax=Sulfitobacter sp. D35 TaxID=3083252 RepID=UPI00296FC305|nr:hypothetical protein [Sulfitobacter sp. D35]MDW4497859.1 hypothetical protein [Sulfitobacter sp. D35]